MKILYIHQYFNTPRMPGSTRSYEFAKRLVNRGDTVYMITTNWQGESNLSYSLEDGIHVYWAPISYNNKMSYLKRIFVFSRFLWYVYSLGRKLNYDLIIASSTPLSIAVPSILLKKVKGVKMVFEIRDLWPQLPIAIGAIKSKLLIKLARGLEKFTYINSNHIICLSPGMKTELKKTISDVKITVVTNLSDLMTFQNKQKNNHEIKASILSNKKIILYAGAFGRINGLLYLVEIANVMKRLNPDLSFLLVGNGYDKDLIISKSKKYGIYNKSLFCIDYVSKNQMPGLLSKATIITSFFIDLPEMENNSANKFFDGLAAGKPIMINYGGWQRDLLHDSGSGFFIPSNDKETAAKIINKVISNNKTLDKMSKASYQLAHKFDIDTNYIKFERVIDNIF